MSSKRKAAVPPMEQTDAALKEQLRMEGWKFSSDEVPASVSPPAPAEEVGEKLLGLVIQNGRLAVDEILKTMAADARPLVQAHACEAISMLAANDTGRSHILPKGAVAAVVAAMSQHPSEAAVQAKGCAAISNLTIGDGEAAVLHGFGLDGVLAAMAAHPADGAVQLKGCAALGNIGFGEAGEAAAVEKHGIEAIVQALHAHGTNAQLVEEAADALANLAANATGKQILLSLGGVQLLAAAHAAYPACEPIRDLLAALQQP
jgi:hypothetical protein